MDVEVLLLHHADELGMSEDVGISLYTTLESLCNSLSDVMDLGIYFHSMTRCEAECNRYGLPVEGCVWLWAVCVSLRDQIEGSIAIYRCLMQKEEAVRTAAMVPCVETLPPFWG